MLSIGKRRAYISRHNNAKQSLDYNNVSFVSCRHPVFIAAFGAKLYTIHCATICFMCGILIKFVNDRNKWSHHFYAGYSIRIKSVTAITWQLWPMVRICMFFFSSAFSAQMFSSVPFYPNTIIVLTFRSAHN